MRIRSLFTPRLALAQALGGLVVLLGSCVQDPVHDQEVAALGPEFPGVPPGPFHRAGQPCTVCHSAEGPASTQFSLAGTVFDAKGSCTGVNRAQILLVDDLGASPTTPILTNCVGNFYVTSDVYSPSFPVSVGVAADGIEVQMITQISRASSCAQCHGDPPSYDTVGHIYIDVSPNPAEEEQCPVSTVAPAGDGGCL